MILEVKNTTHADVVSSTRNDKPHYSKPFRTYRFYKNRDLLKVKFRRQFFREFQNWYRDNQSRFMLPLRLFGHTKKTMSFTVGKISGFKMFFCISYGAKGYQDGGLSFYWGDECIDNIGWMDTYPKKIKDGYICRECHREGMDLRVFSSKLDLWVDHIFEAVLKIVNETIAGSQRIELLQWNSGGSYVRFVNKGENPEPLGVDTRVIDSIIIQEV